MKILGIGNAIVDVICKVEDKFITQNNLTKSTMKLVDEAEFKKLLSTLKIKETVSSASKYAESSPLPDKKELLTDIFAE